MAEHSIKTIVQINTKPASQWVSSNPILKLGELAIESDTLKMKFGNGSSRFSDLAYIKASAYDVYDWAKNSSKPSYSKSEIGLGNVDNIRQYSASNPPPYPVTSINSKTGNVNITYSDVGAAPTSHSHNYLPLTGGTLTGALNPNGGINHSGTSSSTYIAYPSDGRVRANTSSYTGYMKITLPQSWSNTMLRFRVEFYNYSTNTSAEYVVGGYNYSSTWGNNYFAYSIGNNSVSTLNNLTVRFGHDGTKCAIYIGESNTSWAYTQVTVKDITVGYSNYSYSQWYSGWNIEWTTTLGTITATVNNPSVTYYTTNSDMLDGFHASQSPGARNSVVTTNSSGYIMANYINTNVGEENPSIGDFIVINSSKDGYMRKATLAHVKSQLGSFPANGGTSSACSGNSATSSKWYSPRVITLSNHASGAVSIDGSTNVTLSVTNRIIDSVDTRSTNPLPSSISRGTSFDFKNMSIVGLTSAEMGTYGGLMTFQTYSDKSGGPTHQLAFGTTGQIKHRIANSDWTAWNGWTEIAQLDQTNGYWGFKFGSNDTYFRTPINGLLPYKSGTSTGSVIGTSSWRFDSAYINTVYGNLSGNASSATSSTNATYASMTNGVYTGSGGAQPPSYIPKGKVRWNMMNGAAGAGSFAGYCDCMLMDTYTGGDVPSVTGIGLLRDSTSARGYIFSGTQGGSSWSKVAELITSENIYSQTVSNSSNLGGIDASSYINTSDTLILVGTI